MFRLVPPHRLPVRTKKKIGSERYKRKSLIRLLPVQALQADKCKQCAAKVAKINNVNKFSAAFTKAKGDFLGSHYIF